MKLKLGLLGLFLACLFCVPAYVGCGPSFKSEEETEQQLKNEFDEEMNEDEVKNAPNLGDEEGEEADEEALTEEDIK